MDTADIIEARQNVRVVASQLRRSKMPIQTAMANELDENVNALAPINLNMVDARQLSDANVIFPFNNGGSIRFQGDSDLAHILIHEPLNGHMCGKILITPTVAGGIEIRVYDESDNRAKPLFSFNFVSGNYIGE